MIQVTKRQYEMLELLKKGLTGTEIAAAMHLSYSRERSLLQELLYKFKLRNLNELLINIKELEYVVKNYDSFVEADDIPYIVPSQQDSKLFTIIIVAFASFFLFVFMQQVSSVF